MQQQERQPLISVVMPVYNAGDFLVDAIESILNQTYKNFEFVIVDDASTDNSLNILKKYARKTKKIRLFKNISNQGVSITVKRAIKEARGTFLARMDADDIALPQRLEKQIDYLLKHKKTVAIGGQCLVINKEGEIIGEKKFPESFTEIYRYIYRFIPLQQPTLMIARKRLPSDFVYYVDGMNTAEEIELFFKLFKYGKVENLPHYLLFYRIHEKNTSLIDVKQTFLLTLVARLKGVFIYGYKPGFLGVLITLFQTITVLLLSRKMIIIVYKMTKKLSTYKQSAIFSFNRASVEPTISI